MIVGLCYPTSGAAGAVDPARLEIIRQTRVTHLRVDLQVGNPNVDEIVLQTREAGFGVLPVLGFDRSTTTVAAFADFADNVVTDHQLETVEIVNEPTGPDYNLSPDQYREIVEAVSPRIKGRTRILVAGDFIVALRQGPRRKDWFRKARLDPDLFDAVAIHPYREPGSPEASAYGTRRGEYAAWRKEAGGKPLVVTEVGWLVGSNVNEQKQGDYIFEELAINDAVGLEATYIFSHAEDPRRDFGVFRIDGSPRPAAYRLAQFQSAAPAPARSPANPGLLFPFPFPYASLFANPDPVVEVPPAPIGWPT